ncbi:PilW family protein [Marinobacterium litorale]|uniref:PilW family protein n=1 Tax=Marinobacterium litorale TaxID=404770 RepID=UPI000406E409|nr:prepilin-type N-terminal cleavage/methylation domain-containing protein [Marinobacterium litorale]
MKKNIRQAGMSLIELMIAIFVGLIVVAGALTVYVNTVSSSSSTLKMSMLNQELSTLMSVMAMDIRRAGYSGLITTSPVLDNGFQVDATPEDPSDPSDPDIGKQMITRVIDTYGDDGSDITDVVSAPGANSPGECILYAYDANLDGNADNSEFIGFRLVSGAVDMRNSVTDASAIVDNNDGGGANYPDSCADASGSWETVTDDELIEITELTFNLDKSTCLNTTDSAKADCYDAANTPATGDITIENYVVTIRIAGQLKNDPIVRAELEQDVQIRNAIVRER